MSKFKVGDRVKCVREYPQWLTVGKEYVVTDVYPTPTVCVRGDEGMTGGFDPWYFELAESEKEVEPDESGQEPETFEYNGKIYRRATPEDSGSHVIMCDHDISDTAIRAKEPYVSKGKAAFRVDEPMPWRKNSTKAYWKFAYVEVEQPKYRPIGPADAEPTIEQSVQSTIDRSMLIYKYLDAKRDFEAAMTSYNEACQAIRDKLKNGEKFVYTRYGEGYIVQRDKDGFTVERIDMV